METKAMVIDMYRNILSSQIDNFSKDYPTIYNNPLHACRRMYYIMVDEMDYERRIYGLEFLFYNLLKALNRCDVKIEDEYLTHVSNTIRRAIMFHGNLDDDVRSKDNHRDLDEELIKLSDRESKYSYRKTWMERIDSAVNALGMYLMNGNSSFRKTSSRAYDAGYPYMNALTELYLFLKYGERIVFIRDIAFLSTNPFRELENMGEEYSLRDKKIMLYNLYNKQVAHLMHDLKRDMEESINNRELKSHLEQVISDLIHKCDLLHGLRINYMTHRSKILDIDYAMSDINSINVHSSYYTKTCVI